MVATSLHAECIAPLTHLAVISARGADAASFLHSQLTQDIQTLPDDTARLAGYCTAKGRLLATMVVWREPDDGDAPQLRMLVRADLAEALVKRLAMFVLRAKVKLAVEPITVYGATATQSEVPADILPPPWQCLRTPSGLWIGAPSANSQHLRGWCLGAVAGADADAAAWDAADIAAGLPWIATATQDRFIPQTLNLDLIGGVSFTKGCYPGQEVVARSHYRGTLKRRMAAGYCTAAVEHAEWLSADADLFDAHHPDQPWGRIVNVAIAQNTAWLLFEAQLNNLDEADLRLGHPQGAAIALHPLPYALAVES